MRDCIAVMEQMFGDLASGSILQPLRSLMWLPDRSGLLGLMPGFAAGPNIIGVKLITIFPANGPAGLPSHQGLVVLFEGTHGQPVLLLDAAELTAIRTAAVSAVATRLLARQDASTLAVLGTGEQARKHVEAISLVRRIDRIHIWGRNEVRAKALCDELISRYPVQVCPTPKAAVDTADIVCTVTAAAQPILEGKWLKEGAHLNVVGSSTPTNREVDTPAMLRARLFTDRYESLFREAGDFIIPKNEGKITDSHALGEIGKLVTGAKEGRTGPEDITLFKSLGIAAEDLYAAWHVYRAT